jgi:protein SHQ1
MFAYVYDARTTQHDPTPESAWTISNLTPVFSALDPPPYDAAVVARATSFTASELIATLIPSYRRSLAFPLYRSFKLAEACQADIANLFSMGRRTVVRCLLEMKHVLDHHEVYYVYSKIWVDDFCSWTQSGARFASEIFSPLLFLFKLPTQNCDSDETLTEIGNKLKTLRIEKNLIGWDLEELEQTVRETAADQRSGMHEE